MKIRSLVSLAISATALIFSANLAAQNYKAEYKMSIVLGSAYPWGKGAEHWANLVQERTQNRIKIKIYPNVSLLQGDQTREFTALRQGVIDMAVGSTINWSPQIKQLNLFSMPFLTPNYAAIDALTQGEVGQDLFNAIEKAGVIPLAWGENGFREITNSKHPIEHPNDLKGLKIRVVGSPLFLDTFTALGANPTQMSWSDAQPALASGAVDGQENSLLMVPILKMQTIGQKYVTTWGYSADPLIFVVNKEVWNSWSAADQAIVKQAVLDAGKAEIAIARKGLIEADQPLIQEVKNLGITVTQLTPEQRAAFVQATRPVYEKWKNRIGADLVTKAEKAIAALPQK